MNLSQSGADGVVRPEDPLPRYGKCVHLVARDEPWTGSCAPTLAVGVVDALGGNTWPGCMCTSLSNPIQLVRFTVVVRENRAAAGFYGLLR